MENQLLDLMDERRSVRRFLNKPVEWEKVVRILHAAKSAPSEGNLQAWKYIVVKDKKKIESLAKSCYKQMWISQAPILLVVVGEVDKAEKYYSRGELYNTMSSGACIQNILLEAQNLDLGACWVSAFDEDGVINLLDIDSDKKPMAVIPIGYSGETPITPRKEDLKDMVFIEKWGQNVHDLDLKDQKYRYVERGLTFFEKLLKFLNNIPNKVRNLIDKFK